MHYLSYIIIGEGIFWLKENQSLFVNHAVMRHQNGWVDVQGVMNGIH